MINIFQSTLTGAQENGPNNSTATGLAYLELSSAGDALTYGIQVTGLDFGSLPGLTTQTPQPEDDVMGIHFHIGDRTTNGPIVFGIFSPSQDSDRKVTQNANGSTTITGRWDLSDPANQPLNDFVPGLKSINTGEDSNLYLNIYTKGFGSGEIRGQLIATGTINLIDGTDNPDSLDGSPGNDNILGYLGQDLVLGLEGNDVLYGGRGEDTLDGGRGDDVVYGGKNADLVFGGMGSDLIQGDGGEDTLTGADPNNSLPGLLEIDTLVGGFGNDVFVLGDQNKSYYNDGDDLSDGRNDYAIISDFDSTTDKIQLKGPLDNYIIGNPADASIGGTVIYQTTALENELIAFLPGVTNLTIDNFIVLI